MSLSKTSLPKPTQAELGILRILWQKGTATVRDVHETLQRTDSTGYTTALKLLQVMYQKGLVQRDDSERAHVYTATLSKDDTQGQYVTDMIQRVFEGSPSKLVMQALGSGNSTDAAELEQIRRYLDSLGETDD